MTASSVRYIWYRGTDKLGEGASYTVTQYDEGSVLSVEAEVISNDNKKYTKKVSLPAAVLCSYSIGNLDDQVLFRNGVTKEEVLEELQRDYAQVKVYSNNREATVNIKWVAPENFESNPTSVKKQAFVGTLTTPSDGYLEQGTVTMNVIVKLENSLAITAAAGTRMYRNFSMSLSWTQAIGVYL